MKLPRRGVAIGFYVAMVAALAAVIVAAAFNVLGTEWAAASAAAATLLAALYASVQSEMTRRPPEDMAREFARSLTPQVLEDWTAEMPARGLEPIRRMKLRWALGAGSNPNTQQAAGLAGHGTLDQLTDCIGRAAAGGWLPRLVVAGMMGGGKTATCILLTVELAERQCRLPVLVQLATWAPEIPLRDWIASQLPEIFPGIGRSRYGRKVAAILADRHIVPILDGLDEVREIPAALRAIDEQLSGRPFVLTCRTKEFAQANRGSVLHQAVIVELQPLGSEEARDILVEYEPAVTDSPLAPLIALLGSEPAGPVAQALSTPFMLSLARDTGASLPGLATGAPDPETVDAITQRLLGTLVRKAYADDQGISRQQAARYLKFLAEHTDSAGRLAWWLLYRAVPRAVFVIVGLVFAGGLCSGLGALFFTLFGHPWLGFWIGLGAASGGAVADALVPQEPPRRARPRLRSLRVPVPSELARIVGFGAIGGAALAVIVLVLYGPVSYAIIAGVLSAVTYALASYVGQPNDPLKVVTPISLLSADRTTVLIAWLVGAIPGALTGAYLGLSFPAGHRIEFDGLAVLKYSTPELALIGAACGCALTGAGLGLMALGASAWGKFIITQFWLALRGSLPLHLMSFLGEAYKRGLLRQVNGYYEFRHRMLQRYFADLDL